MESTNSAFYLFLGSVHDNLLWGILRRNWGVHQNFFKNSIIVITLKGSTLNNEKKNSHSPM